MPYETPRLVTPREAAAYRGVGETTIRRWIKNGVLRAYRDPYFIRVDLNDLDRLARPVEATEATA